MILQYSTNAINKGHSNYDNDVLFEQNSTMAANHKVISLQSWTRLRVQLTLFCQINLSRTLCTDVKVNSHNLESVYTLKYCAECLTHILFKKCTQGNSHTLIQTCCRLNASQQGNRNDAVSQINTIHLPFPTPLAAVLILSHYKASGTFCSLCKFKGTAA